MIWINIAVLLLTWLISISAYSDLPPRIPVHFTWDGTIDHWSDKTPLSFFFLPALGTVLVVAMMILTRFPRLYNFPERELVRTWPLEQRKMIYDLFGRMMLMVALAIALVFLVIQYTVIKGAQHQRVQPQQFWLILVLGLAALPIVIYHMVKVGKVIEETKRRAKL